MTRPVSPVGAFTIDVEDWFHILDSDAAPSMETWDAMECRIERSMESLLDLLDRFHVKATMFWLGWMAERHPDLVRRCHAAGHEIASHGYAHLLAFRVGPKAFRDDLVRARDVLEDLVGEPILGYRAPGFGITPGSEWAFEEIRAAGHTYDSSVFPASRLHGGLPDAPLKPYLIETASGPLVEVPTSVVSLMGRRMALFGGGYLRLAPRWLIHWGVDRLARQDLPLIVYIHPREVDPEHPRLPLSAARRFKCYVNLRGTMTKLRDLCMTVPFVTLGELTGTRSPLRPEPLQPLPPLVEGR